MFNSEAVRNEHREKGRQDVRREELLPLQQRFTALEVQLTAAQQAQATAAAESMDLREQTIRLTQERDVAQANISIAANNISTLNAEKNELLRRLELSQTERVDLDSENVSIRDKILILDQQLSQKLAEIQENNKTIEGLQSQITTLVDRLHDAEASLNMHIRDMTLLRQADAKSAKENAENIAKRINKLRIELKMAGKDRVKYAKEIVSLENQIDTLNTIRKEACIDRAIVLYLRNMKRTDTYGGDIELQAVANVLNINIELWEIKDGSYRSTLIKAASLRNDTSSTAPLRILKYFHLASSSNFAYECVTKELVEKFNAGEEILAQSSVDAKCLFVACVRAFQLSKNHELPLGNNNLDSTAHNLRLQVCEYLSKNSAPLHDMFNDIIDQISAVLIENGETDELIFSPPVEDGGEELSPAYISQLEQEWYENKKRETEATSAQLRLLLDGDFIYRIVEASLSRTCKAKQFIDNFCKLIAQHYPGFSDKSVRDAEYRANSISSYSSLEDEDDYVIIGASTFEADLKNNDIEIIRFFKGSEVVGASNDNIDDSPNLSLAKRYVYYINSNDKHIGGPIEIQALADIYDWEVHLKAFKGAASYGEPQYFNIFKPSTAKKKPTSVYLVLVNATTSSAKFILTDSGWQSHDIEARSSGSLYKSCKTIAMKTEEDIKAGLVKYLTQKIESSTYDPLATKKVNDGISRYFDDYIYRGYKGQGEIKEFDLIPSEGCACIVEAHRLRATRKIIFRTANSILNDLRAKVSSEMNEWNVPLSSLANRTSLSIAPVNKHKLATQGALVLELTGLALLIASAVIGERDASVNDTTYYTLQSLSLASSLLGPIVYYVRSYYAEKSRAIAVKNVQNLLIINLPFDKISKIYLYNKDVAIPFTIHEGSASDHMTLSNEWAKDEYSKLSFVLKHTQEEFFITKEESLTIRAASYSDNTKDYLAETAMALLMISNIILTSLTINSVREQVAATANATNNTEENTTTAAPTQFTVSSPSTVWGSIAMAPLLAIIIMSHAAYGASRICEKELSRALEAIKNTYANNQGQLPEELSKLLQTFGVKGEISNALTSTPQMVNIQRSLFKASQELKGHIDDLREKASKGPEDVKLLQALEDIEAQIHVSKMEELHSSKAALDKLTVSVQNSSSSSTTVLFSGNKHIYSTIRRLSGIFSFSAASSNRAQKDKQAPSSAPRHNME